MGCFVILSTSRRNKLTSPMMIFREFQGLWVHSDFTKISAFLSRICKDTKHIPNNKSNSRLQHPSHIPPSTLNWLPNCVFLNREYLKWSQMVTSNGKKKFVLHPNLQWVNWRDGRVPRGQTEEYHEEKALVHSYWWLKLIFWTLTSQTQTAKVKLRRSWRLRKQLVKATLKTLLPQSMVLSKTGSELAAPQKVNLWSYPRSPESELRNWHAYLITDCHACTLHVHYGSPTILFYRLKNI